MHPHMDVYSGTRLMQKHKTYVQISLVFTFLQKPFVKIPAADAKIINRKHEKVEKFIYRFNQNVRQVRLLRRE